MTRYTKQNLQLKTLNKIYPFVFEDAPMFCYGMCHACAFDPTLHHIHTDLESETICYIQWHPLSYG